VNYYSTKNRNIKVSFRDALLKGIADDGGLYMPETIPILEENFFKEIKNFSLQEIGVRVAKQFVSDISESGLAELITKAVNFPAPLIQLSNELSILELFHGPTLAFKDFGARFLATFLEFYLRNEKKETLILVATSGDTGSAVANGFYEKVGIKVALLYPGGKVSKIQEQQLTTLGKNIYPFEIDGVFDDCQRLVKQAFHDPVLQNAFSMTSANSINIARLLPQSFYYFEAYRQLQNPELPFLVSVPSGNFGNLTAGLFAKAMGLPVSKFIAAVNANKVFPEYLESGAYNPRHSVQTLSNAMDVGDPSNFARIMALFDDNLSAVKQNIWSTSFSDTETIEAIKVVKEKFNYTIDPHGAVGYLALQDYLKIYDHNNVNGVVLETAHPAKFSDIVDDTLNEKTVMPERLAACLSKQKGSVKTSKDYSAFREAVLQTIS